MLIPVISAVVMFAVYKHRATWWEYLLPTVVTLCLALPAKFLVETVQTNDTEYWTGYVVNVTYLEGWTEHYTTTSTDSKGNSHTEHHYVYHSPEYFITDNNGCRIHVNYSTFEYFCQKFKNKTFTDLFHFSQSSWGDGNEYDTAWDNKNETFTPCTSLHRYTNKIQAADSVFKFPEVSQDDKVAYGLYDYPGVYDYYRCQSVLGFPGSDLLDYWNAKLGKQKQIRMWLLNFPDQPAMAGQLQEALWDGGNKNDLVVCVGTSGGKTTWCYAFSWSESHDLKQEIRDYVVSGHTVSEIISFMAAGVEKKWVRKQFADFDYLTVEPPVWAVVIVFILTIIVNGGVCWWAIHNEHAC